MLIAEIRRHGSSHRPGRRLTLGACLAGLVALLMFTVGHADGAAVRDDASPWQIPIDKTYDQLSTTDRAALRSAYKNLPEYDEPPYPLKGLQSFAAPLMENRIGLKAHGLLNGVASVDRHGHVQSSRFFKSPNDQVTVAVADLLMRTRFKPASCGGSPCEMDFPVKINFDLR